MDINTLLSMISKTKTDLNNASAHLERLRGERTALEEQRRSRMDEVGLGASAALQRRQAALFGHHSLPPASKPDDIIQLEQQIKDKDALIKNLQGITTGYAWELSSLENQYKELTTAQDPNNLGARVLNKHGYNASSFKRQ